MNVWQEYKEATKFVQKQQEKIIKLNILIRDADKILGNVCNPSQVQAYIDQVNFEYELKKWRENVQKEIGE